MDNATTIVGFVLAGLTIAGVIIGYLQWQIKREKKLLMVEVREAVAAEVKKTVNGKIDSVTVSVKEANDKLDVISDEAEKRWTETQTRLAEGSAQFGELHRITKAATNHRTRIEDRVDKLVDSR